MLVGYRFMTFGSFRDKSFTSVKTFDTEQEAHEAAATYLKGKLNLQYTVFPAFEALVEGFPQEQRGFIP